MNSRHPEPRRVLGRCRAAVRGPDPRDPLDPGMESFLRVLGIKNNENETSPFRKVQHSKRVCYFCFPNVNTPTILLLFRKTL